jgi:hypothetical protein
MKIYFTSNKMEVWDSKIVKETFAPQDVESFSHIQENRASLHVLVKVSAELLVTQQTALLYFSYDPSEQDHIEELTNSVKGTNGFLEEGNVRSFLGFSMDTTRACFHAYGKYCLRRTARNPFVRKAISSYLKLSQAISSFDRCLRSLFGIPLGPEALPPMSPFTACRISEGLVSSS